jgi:WD40 repeat protein
VGGFGVVYCAFDTTLQRDVALKLPRNLSFADEQVKSAFLREARAAAALRHPHIVPIFDAGEIDEQCYLTAAFCPGETLSVWRKRNGGHVPPRTAAAISRQLAGALAHAHEAGILHQDVKPENVLLDADHPTEGLPFTLLLTDFGLARLMDGPDTVARSSVAFGTARYMAPEQAARSGKKIGPAVDVYAVGVILYELLTGRAPIQGADELETLSRLAVDVPPAPDRFVSDLPRDLGAICLKCLEKDPGHRYATARELEADLQRFLDGHSTLARPHSAWERAWRTMRRHPTGAALVATLILSLAGFIVGLGLHVAQLREHGQQLQSLNARLEALLRQSEEATERANRREGEVKDMLYASGLRLAGRAWREGDARVLHERLIGQIPGPGEVDRRDFAWRFLAGFDRPAQAETHVSRLSLYAVVISPDGRHLAVAGHDGTVRILDAESLDEVESFDSGQTEVNGLDFARDGRRLASAGQDGSVCVWELPGGRRLQHIQAHPAQAYQCVFVDNDRLVISCGEDDPVIRIWDLETASSVGTLSGHDDSVECVALAPSGNTLASVSCDRTARLWDLASRSLLHTLAQHHDKLTSVCFVRNGRVLATGGLDCQVCLWDVDSGNLLGCHTLYDPIQSLSAARDDVRIIAGDRGGALTMFRSDLETVLPGRESAPQSDPVPRDLTAVILNAGEESPVVHRGDRPMSTVDIRAWPAHLGRIYSLARAATGVCYSAGEDGFVRKWSTETHSPVRSWPRAPGNEMQDIADLAQVGGFIAVGKDSIHTLRPSSDGIQIESLPREGTGGLSPCLACDGATLLGFAENGRVSRWPWGRLELQDLGTLRTGKRPTGLAMSPDATEFVAIDFGENLVLWHDARNGAEVASLITRDPRSIAWSPDGDHILVAALDDVLLVDARSHELVQKIATHRGPANCVAIHPDGRLAASGGSDRCVILTDITNRRETGVLRGHRAIVTAVAFSPEGRCLATADGDGTIKLWNTATRQYLYDLSVDGGACSKLLFSGDGRRLAALVGGTVVVFEAQFRDSPAPVVHAGGGRQTAD